MKILMLFIGLLISVSLLPAQVLKSSEVELSFYSKAPIEDIYAVSRKGVSAFDLETRTVYVKVLIRSFEFEKKLMQQHFNENYLESNKYPYAEFKGTVSGDFDPAKPGTYQVKVSGKLKIHGVNKDYTMNGQLHVDKGAITASSEFPVRLADHEVQIPRILIKNIAEVVQVTVFARYEAFPEAAGTNSALP